MHRYGKVQTVQSRCEKNGAIVGILSLYGLIIFMFVCSLCKFGLCLSFRSQVLLSGTSSVQ